MRQFLRAAALTIILGALSFPKSGMAQELRLVVVNIEQLTFTSDEGNLAADKLKKKFDEITAIMTKLQKEIDDKETTLRTGERALSTAAKQAIGREIDNLKIAFDRKNQDYQKEMMDYQNELMDPIAAKAQAMLQKYIKDKGFTMVIDLSAENSNVVWNNPANDITLDVIKLLNDEFKKAPGAAATTPAAARPPATGTPAPAANRPPATNTAPAGGAPRTPAANTPATTPAPR
jgi:Skp family chaperone for outer membrane proteins